MAAHRLWAGVALLIAAAAIQAAWGGSWALAMIVALGILLTITSYGGELAR